MRRTLTMLAVMAVLAGCGGGGGNAEPNPNPNPNPNPGAGDKPPTVASAVLSDSPSSFPGSEVTVQGGTATTLYVDYQWADPNGDFAKVHISYVTLDRELVADADPDTAGRTSGEDVVHFDVPATDGAGVSSLDLWVEDSKGLASNKVRLHYTTTQLPTGTRDNPVPIGTGSSIGNGWTLRVDGITPNATQAVLDENQFNDPPAPGHQFFIARITTTYTGPGSDSYDASFNMRAVGASGVTYTTFQNSCGVIPDDYSEPELFTGGSASGNVCWEIVSGDVASLEVFDDDSRVFFDLSP